VIHCSFAGHRAASVALNHRSGQGSLLEVPWAAQECPVSLAHGSRGVFLAFRVARGDRRDFSLFFSSEESRLSSAPAPKLHSTASRETAAIRLHRFLGSRGLPFPSIFDRVRR
jgi:hypothetical protein